MRHRAPAAAAALALCAALTGCAASTIGGHGSATAVPSSGPRPTGSAPASPYPSDVGAKSAVALVPTTGATSATVAHDFVAARFSTPAGWQRVSGYYQVVPLETSSYLSYYTKPTTELDGRGVVAVLIYTLPAAGLVETAATQRARVEYYTRRVKATVQSPVVQTALAGRTAYRETLSQPGGFEYTTWFVFGTRHVLQLSCQRGAATEAAKIDTGCDAVRASLRIS